MEDRATENLFKQAKPVLRAQARQLTYEEIFSDEMQRLIRDMRGELALRDQKTVVFFALSM